MPLQEWVLFPTKLLAEINSNHWNGRVPKDRINAFVLIFDLF